MDFTVPKVIHANKPKNVSQEEFIEKESTCPLCGHKLYVLVELSLKEDSLYEEAHCSNCCIRTRKRKHKMH